MRLFAIVRSFEVLDRSRRALSELLMLRSRKQSGTPTQLMGILIDRDLAEDPPLRVPFSASTKQPEVAVTDSCGVNGVWALCAVDEEIDDSEAFLNALASTVQRNEAPAPIVPVTHFDSWSRSDSSSLESWAKTDSPLPPIYQDRQSGALLQPAGQPWQEAQALR